VHRLRSQLRSIGHPDIQTVFGREYRLLDGEPDGSD
jgi:hypothetical protein